MKTRWLGAALALAAGMAFLPSGSRALSTGECADLSVQIKGLPEAAAAECEAGSFGGGGDQGSGTDEFIRMMNARSVFIVVHAFAGRQTYLNRISVKAMIGRFRGLDDVGDWGEEGESGDFTVRRFRAKLSGSGGTMACFGFSLYAGHFARTSGYRHHLGGFYCDFDGTEITDGRIAELVGSIEYSF
jgi:hypothetical protein